MTTEDQINNLIKMFVVAMFVGLLGLLARTCNEADQRANRAVAECVAKGGIPEVIGFGATCHEVRR